MDEAPSPLRSIDNDTLLDMYDAARAADHADECDVISAELTWRGINVRPCSSRPACVSAAANEPTTPAHNAAPNFSLRGH